MLEIVTSPVTLIASAPAAEVTSRLVVAPSTRTLVPVMPATVISPPVKFALAAWSTPVDSRMPLSSTATSPLMMIEGE